MTAGRRQPVPILLTLLLLAAWVTGATSRDHYQRHADFYRTRYRPQHGAPAPRSDLPRHTSPYHHTVPAAADRRHQRTAVPADDGRQQRRQTGGGAAGRWWQRADRRSQRQHTPAQDAVYHRRDPAAASSRRSDTIPAWVDDASPASGRQPGQQPGQQPGRQPGQQPGQQPTAGTLRHHGRTTAGQISVQIGQSHQNFSVSDGVVIGAEHVKLWRTDRLLSGADFRELSEIGGEVWLNNGTALYKRGQASAYEELSNEISDTMTIQQPDKDKEAKLFFPLFTLIRFPNDPCEGSQQQDGFSASGTCYLPQECSDRAGLASGSCALGFGVCCVFSLSCGGSSDQNGTLFVNPEYPESGSAARSCSFSVHKLSSDITQIRLDFLEFTMAGPTDGSCSTDTFSVSGQNTNAPVPTLCGQNSGQHVYVEVGERTGPIQLRALTGPGPSRRRWRVRVTQYTRRTEGSAPAGCLQYYTGQLGSFESFNYPAAGTDAGYLNQLNYMICIRKESGFCSITYGVDRFDRFSTPEQFEIFNVKVTIVNGVMVVRSTVPAGQAGVGPIQCPDDYILLSADRLCGDRLNDGSVNSQLTQNADVTDATGGQFTVKFVSNESTVGRGFRLYFRQNSCRSRRS